MEWLETIGVFGGFGLAEHGKTVIRITIGDVTPDGILYDTAFGGLLSIFLYLTALTAGKELYSH